MVEPAWAQLGFRKTTRCCHAKVHHGAVTHQRVRGDLVLDLGFAHLVQRLDRHLRVFGPVLDDHELTTRL